MVVLVSGGFRPSDIELLYGDCGSIEGNGEYLNGNVV
jgi:hypothetical protein